jgi:hypothetical protein
VTLTVALSNRVCSADRRANKLELLALTLVLTVVVAVTCRR